MPLLMATQPGQPGRVTEHAPIAATPNLPFVACELCRERMSAPPICAKLAPGSLSSGQVREVILGVRPWPPAAVQPWVKHAHSLKTAWRNGCRRYACWRPGLPWAWPCICSLY